VNLERRGFNERQQRGTGACITRADCDRRTPPLASELLRNVAGVQLMRRSNGPGFVPVGRGSCGFRYVLNGARVGAGFEIDDISPEWIEAIEAYRGPATVPTRVRAHWQRLPRQLGRDRLLDPEPLSRCRRAAPPRAAHPDSEAGSPVARP
jgi:hypothetical protein